MRCPGVILLAALVVPLKTSSQEARNARSHSNPQKPDRMGAVDTGPYDYGVMGPPATPAIVAAAVRGINARVPSGPFKPAWDSLEKNYKTPSWFEDAKFGIFMHWGVYAAAAHGSEWYEKHMYGSEAQRHTQKFGPHEKFGYKDLIPLFTAANWDPDAWAVLFKKAGARLVMPTAQHHDNFALWDSILTRFNAKKMGPRRDLIGDLADAVRRRGLRFALSNHGVENFTFITPPPELAARLQAARADLFDPERTEFYNVADRSNAAMTRFLADWANRNVEIIEKYRPDILWFDNGINLRVLDPLKLYLAAYYYNRAREWGKEVSLSSKFNAYAPSNDHSRQIGSILDFEKVGVRSPKDVFRGPWMVDDAIASNSWGYIEGLRVFSAETILGRLIDTVSKSGFYMLNISPKADGTIPEDQQNVLRRMGSWLEVNGEAIYGTRPCTRFGDDAKPGYRFTTKGDTVYAIALNWPDGDAIVPSLASAKLPGRIDSITMLGSSGKLEFTQDAESLKIQLPADRSGSMAWVFQN